ncbi:hypothetical protein ABN028_19770 [Actinopolymorpha sp. B17G11]|uniref:hypothetical protein n=1 Tax=Actinopolymorpha sp. B17G11 TaxID=3160861 RepID=UPI0032E3F6BF
MNDPTTPVTDPTIEGCRQAAHALAPAVHQSEEARARIRARILRELQHSTTPSPPAAGQQERSGDLVHEVSVDGGKVRIANIEEISEDQALTIAARAVEMVRRRRSERQPRG